MGRASSIYYFNKTLTGIKHKRSLIMALSKRWDAMLMAREEERTNLWWDSLTQEERQKACGSVDTTWVESNSPVEPQLPYGLRMATAAEIMLFGSSR